MRPIVGLLRLHVLATEVGLNCRVGWRGSAGRTSTSRGRWSDGGEIEGLTELSKAYRAEVRRDHELARALRSCGYDVENSRRGDLQLVGVSQEGCERFSKRHREIDVQTQEFLARKPQKKDANVFGIREHLAHTLRSRKIRHLGSSG